MRIRSGCSKIPSRISPDDFSILVNLGVELAKAGRPAEAIPFFEHASDLYRNAPILNYKLSQESHKLYHNWALACEELNREDEAIRHYEEAIEIRPDYALSHYNLGLVLQRYGACWKVRCGNTKAALQVNPAFAAAQCNTGAYWPRPVSTKRRFRIWKRAHGSIPTRARS